MLHFDLSTVGAFNPTEIPGLNFRNFRMSNGTVFSTRPDRSRFLFPLEHITHQNSLDKMLKDRDEVAVSSAVLSCFMWGSLTRIQNSTLR